MLSEQSENNSRTYKLFTYREKMSSRLYPGFGTGKGIFEGHFTLRPIVGPGAPRANNKLRCSAISPHPFGASAY